MTRPRRNTTTRDRHRGAIAKTRPPCGICGEPIDYELPWTDPRAFVVDHRVPLALGGGDVLANKQAAHRDCNRNKGAKPHADIIKRSGSLERPRGQAPPSPLTPPVGSSRVDLQACKLEYSIVSPK